MWKYLVVVVALMPGTANASSSFYDCKVTTVTALAPDGSVDTNLDTFHQSLLRDYAHLTIDRATGRVFHLYYGLNGPAVTSEVLNPGDAEWSFKALSYTTPGHGHVVYVEVDEFDEGFQKAMRLISSQALVGGTCK